MPIYHTVLTSVPTSSPACWYREAPRNYSDQLRVRKEEEERQKLTLRPSFPSLSSCFSFTYSELPRKYCIQQGDPDSERQEFQSLSHIDL